MPGLYLRIKNKDKNKVICNVNINSVCCKFAQVKLLVQGKAAVREGKIDESIPTDQFLIDGFGNSYILDRNRNGGGVLIYVFVKIFPVNL